MESAVGLLRRYLVKVLREVLALKPSSGVDSSAESSVAEFNSEGGSLGRLVTGRSVHRALQGRKVLAAESDAWVDEDDSPAPPSSAPPLEQPDYGSLAHPPSTNGADDSDDEMQPLRAVSSQPSFVSARFDSNITPLFTSRHYTRPLVHYSSERPLDDETYSIGVVPFEKEESPASTRFFLERSQIIDVSEDEGDFEDELEADARMDHDDFAADLAWEEGLWQTIRNMDDDGLGWLTLGNLIDTDNRGAFATSLTFSRGPHTYAPSPFSPLHQTSTRSRSFLVRARKGRRTATRTTMMKKRMSALTKGRRASFAPASTRRLPHRGSKQNAHDMPLLFASSRLVHASKSGNLIKAKVGIVRSTGYRDGGWATASMEIQEAWVAEASPPRRKTCPE